MGTTPGRAEQRFPGFDVLGQVPTWDRVTQGVVLGRLGPPPPVRFFAGREPTVRALPDRLPAQDDEPRVPVLETIDRRLVEGRGDGYRYADMPEGGDAWLRSADALDADARVLHGRPYWDLAVGEQMAVVEAVRVHDGDWHGMPAGRVFSLWHRYACAAFYSHRWAWNEIGFGVPAYPRGYKNAGLDRREPWEVRERADDDPIPWVRQAEAAKRRHADALPR
ncbi:MAG: gluconate 2-dehydrogenase subunit 3 family protein [Acidimicrobiales bacterium]